MSESLLSSYDTEAQDETYLLDKFKIVSSTETGKPSDVSKKTNSLTSMLLCTTEFNFSKVNPTVRFETVHKGTKGCGVKTTVYSDRRHVYLLCVSCTDLHVSVVTFYHDP